MARESRAIATHGLEGTLHDQTCQTARVSVQDTPRFLNPVARLPPLQAHPALRQYCRQIASAGGRTTLTIKGSEPR